MIFKQTITTLDATVRALAGRSIENKDISFWDTLATQQTRPSDE